MKALACRWEFNLRERTGLYRDSKEDLECSSEELLPSRVGLWRKEGLERR